MASAVIGAAVIRVLPDSTGFAGKVRREMHSAAQGASRPFRDLGFNIKRQLTSAFSAGLASMNNLKVGAQNLSRFFARNFTIPIGIALGAVTKLTTEFQSGMLRVEALTTRVGDSVTVVNQRMEELSATALSLGRTTEFTANQASEAMQNFALAGFSTNEILQATESTLSLASAGQVELSAAADITTTAIRGFNLEADDAGRVADVMTQTFTNSNTDLTQLGQAFRFVAPVAAAAGLTFEETTAALGILSNAGLKASLAGTSLRGIITKLINPSKKAKGIIEELGIKVFDVEGNMRPLVDIVRDFEGSMRTFGIEVRGENDTVRDLNDILGEVADTGGNVAGVFETITGLDSDQFLQDSAAEFENIGVKVFDANGTLKSFSQVINDSRINAVTASQAMAIFAQRAGPGMLALVSQGADALENLTSANLDSAGRAAEIQAKQMEGLRGSFLLLKSAAEGLAIGIGLTFADSLSEAVRGVADFINVITDWVQANEQLTAQIVRVAGALAALGPGFFVVSKALGLLLFGFTTLLSPVRLVAGALFGLGIFFQRMVANSEALGEALRGTFEIFKAFAGPILTLFSSILGSVVNDVDSLAAALGDRLAGVVENFNKGLMVLVENGAIRDTVGFLVLLFLKVKEFISTTGASAARGVFDFLVDAGEDLVSIFEALLPLFEGFVDFITGEFVRGVAGVAVNALGTFLDALGAIADFIKPLTNLIGRNFTPILVTLGSLFVALKIKAIEFGGAAAVAGASVKANLTAPLTSASAAMLRGTIRLDAISAKAAAAATGTGLFSTAMKGVASTTASASAGLLRTADRMDRLSTAMKKADVGRKALVGLTTAIAGFSLGKMIQEADDLEGALIGVGSAITNIAIATAIGGPLVGAIAATITIVGQLVSIMGAAEKQTFKTVDATDELTRAMDDGSITFRETFEIFNGVFSQFEGGRQIGALLRQIDGLDVATSQFGENLSDLVDAASKSDAAFNDVFDNILTNAFKLRVGAAREIGKLESIFTEFIDNTNLREDGGFWGSFVANRDQQIDETAFAAAATEAGELFDQLLNLDDASLRLSVRFKENKDGSVNVNNAFLEVGTTTDEAAGKLAKLNDLLTTPISEIPMLKLFGEESEEANKALTNSFVQLQRFGIDMSTARIAAELAAPAWERAREQELALLEVTQPLAASFDDVANAINNAADELDALTNTDPVDAERLFLDTLAGFEDIARFAEEGVFPDFGALLKEGTSEGEGFRRLMDGLASDIDRTLIAKAVEAKGDVGKLTEGFDEVRAAAKQAFLDAGVLPEAIPELLDALTRESTVLKLTPEFLIDTEQVKEISEQEAEFFKKQFEAKAEALGLEPGEVFIPVPEFSPEFKESLILEFGDAFRSIEPTTISVPVEVASALPILDGVLVGDQVKFPAVKIPTSLSTLPLISDLENRDLAQEIVSAALRGEESITIPVTSFNLSDLEDLDEAAIRAELAGLGARLGVVGLAGVELDPSDVIDKLTLAIEQGGEEDGKLWAEAFARGIDLSEIDPAIRETIDKIPSPEGQQTILDIVAAGGLLGIGGGSSKPFEDTLPPLPQSMLDQIVEGYSSVAGIVGTTATAVETSNQRITDSIGEMASAATSIPQVFTSVVSSVIGSIAAQVAAFRGLFWSPFRTTVNSAASELGLNWALPGFRFHTGGVVGDGGQRMAEMGSPSNDEVFALLQRGEGVLPRDVMSRMSRDQFEALRAGHIGPEDTFDPRDEMGDAFLQGTLAATARSSQVGDTVNSISSAIIDSMLQEATGAIVSIFARDANDNLGAAIVQEAAMEAAVGAADFLRGANDAIQAIFLGKFGSVSAWPVGKVFAGGSRQEDLSQEIDFMRQMQGQSNSFPAILTYLRATGTPFKVASTLRNSLIRGTDTPSLHNVGRAVDLGGPLGPVFDSPFLRRIYEAFGPVAGLVQRIYSGPGGGGFRPGSITDEDHHDHVHVSLADGAFIRGRVLAELGEAGDEVVIPLDRPERAMALALQSGLFDTLSRATRSGAEAAPAGGTRGSTVLGNFDGGPLGGGPGNTYHLVGVGLDQVKAEIAARDEATVRVRR